MYFMNNENECKNKIYICIYNLAISCIVSETE